MKNVAIVAGSRTFNDYELLRRTMLEKFDLDEDELIIISGTAKGADTLGEQFAEEYNLNLIRMPADWKQFGKYAGFRRNIEMAKKAVEMKADGYEPHLVAFWDAKSKGTEQMISTAEKVHINTTIVTF